MASGPAPVSRYFVSSDDVLAKVALVGAARIGVVVAALSPNLVNAAEAPKPQTAAVPVSTTTASANQQPDAAATGNRTTENVVRQAGDAFGTSIGRETIGLYGASEVRGFSPIAAGNVRIDGLYFDPVWLPNSRIRQASTIRVGLTALGSPFPAPTGLVDYTFRRPGAEAAGSALVNVDAWGSTSLEADAAIPLVKDRFSLGVGGGIFNESYLNGTRAAYAQAAVIGRWTPAPAVEVAPFLARQQIFSDETGPFYVPGGDYLPPRLPRRLFIGPEWSRSKGWNTNAGLLGWLGLGGGWTLRGGLFRSASDSERKFSNQLIDLQPDGRARQRVIADPPISLASTSGEVRLLRQIADGPRRHLFHLSLRGRAGDRRFGGSAAVDLGGTTITTVTRAPKPNFVFSTQQRDRVRQWTAGLAYEGRWQGVGELSAGIQHTRYRKRIGLPDQPPVTTEANLLLFNLNGAAHLTSRLLAYGGVVTGLEESGVAPDSAANRNEALPAIKTRQYDVGLRYALAPKIGLIAGLFEVSKPYFNIGSGNVFGQLGHVVHRGFEASVSGPLSPELSVVLGAVLLRPKVDATGAAGRVGSRPVGAIGRRLEASADWRPSFAPGMSFDINISHRGSQIATVNNEVSIPGRTIINLGGRYRFKLNKYPAALRVQVANVTDKQGFDLRSAGAYTIIAGRLISSYLTVDF
jgi:iron complex outermembrane receptor protein